MIKAVYRFKILPKMATDIPAIIIVFEVAPSHTIRRGASADFEGCLAQRGMVPVFPIAFYYTKARLRKDAEQYDEYEADKCFV